MGRHLKVVAALVEPRIRELPCSEDNANAVTGLAIWFRTTVSLPQVSAHVRDHRFSTKRQLVEIIRWGSSRHHLSDSKGVLVPRVDTAS
jgi:hypothetical protein